MKNLSNLGLSLTSSLKKKLIKKKREGKKKKQGLSKN